MESYGRKNHCCQVRIFPSHSCRMDHIRLSMFRKRPDTIIESCVDVSAEESDPFAVHGTDAISIKDAIIVKILFVITIILFRFSSMSYLREVWGLF